MHNNIMAAGSKDRPPMLGPGRYSQWHSRFLRYLDTKSNGEYLRKCIFEGPYMPTNVLIAAVEAAENILPVAAHEEAETIHNMTTENKLYFQAEKGIHYSPIQVNVQFLSTTSTRIVEICKVAAETGNRQSLISQASPFLRKKVMPEQARRDKDMKKNLALLDKYFKKLYKPTNNNLRTSSNSRNKTEDTTPRYNNDKSVRQFRNQNDYIAGARETVGSLEVSPEESSSTGQPLEQVQNHDENDVFANVRRHSEQPDI
ncbi:hypothetical protein Tco_0366765 [Tanacetum coccineum]